MVDGDRRDADPCRYFAIINSAQLAARIASWIEGRGVRTLMLSAGDAPPRRARRLDDACEVIAGLGPDALRGFLAQGRGRPGSLHLSGLLPERRVLEALEESYEIVILDMGCAQNLDDRLRLLAPIAERLDVVPALVSVSAEEDGGIKSVERCIRSLSACNSSVWSPAFCLDPFDIALAARLARRWRAPSWGDGGAPALLAERILERARAARPGVCCDGIESPVTDPAVSGEDAEPSLRLLKLMREDGEFLRISEFCAAGDDSRELRSRVAQVAARIAAALPPHALRGERASDVIERAVEQAVGLGPLDSLLKDDSITEIMASGTARIYVERSGRIEATALRFASEGHLMTVIERLLAPTGRRVDEASPTVDARLADGSRLHAVIPPLAVDGPALTIRRFGSGRWSLSELARCGMMPQRTADFLASCVRQRISMVVSGGTGTGKTTLLGALASVAGESERIITIEDAAELKIARPHVVRLEARPANIEGAGAVRIRELVRNALRMRPDRIVVGECRGAEAIDMLQAMNTGHEGSLTTVHANSPRDAVSRLETMVLMAGLDLPIAAAREQITRAVRLVVQLARSESERKVVEISEITGMEGSVVSMQTLAMVERSSGQLKETGLVPCFSEEIRAGGEDAWL